MKVSRLAVKSSVLTMIIALLALTADAQNRERVGISAKAGGVNSVSGKVMVKRGATEQLLTSQDDLGSGDVVTTGSESQVEVLLNPGTYLRLSEKSEFVLVDNSLDKLQVKINKGSAIIEATGPKDLEFRIPIVTDQQRLMIVRSGIYRINVTGGVTELLVRKGLVWLDNDPKNIVKSNKKVSFTRPVPQITKLTKLDRDEFDDWSRERGQTLARANEKLSARVLNGYLASSSWSFSGGFSRWGLWTWSPFVSCYTFLPFYYSWASPYGRAYAYYQYRYGYRGEWADANRPYISNSPGNGTFGAGSPPVGTVGPNGGPRLGPAGNVGSSGSGSMSSPPPPQRTDPDSGNRIVNKVRDPIN